MPNNIPNNLNKIWLKALITRLNLNLFQGVPVVLQSEVSECGLSCIVMMCRYYKKDIDLLSLRQRFGLSNHGATLSQLMHIAQHLGLDTRPLSLELEELHLLKTPCILHWDLNHFVLFTGLQGQKAIIHDPALGRRKMPLSELSKHFTGVALELWPNPQFNCNAQRQDIPIFGLLKNIQGIRAFLIKVFALSLLMESINLLLPMGMQLVMDHVILAEDQDLLTLICSALFAFILCRTVLGLFRSWMSLRVDSLVNIQWKHGFFQHLLKLPLNYFEKRNPGDIQSRFLSLDTVRSTMISGIVSLSIDGILCLGLLLMMWLYGGMLLAVVLLFSLIYILLRLFSLNRYRQANEEYIIQQARSSAHFMESMYAITTLKALGMHHNRAHAWMGLNIQATNAGIQVTRLDLFYGGANALIHALDQILILWLGASMVIDQQISLGMFIAFNLYRSQFAERSTSMTNTILQFRMLTLHHARIADIALSPIEPQGILAPSPEFQHLGRLAAFESQPYVIDTHRSTQSQQHSKSHGIDPDTTQQHTKSHDTEPDPTQQHRKSHSTEPDKSQQHANQSEQTTSNSRDPSGHAATLKILQLNYAHDALSQPIIEQLSLEVKAGESVAIVGASGVGKTTLIKLMTGLLQPDQGHILFNNLDIHQMGLDRYRQHIACVLQNDQLFAGSIADNIAGFDLSKDMARIVACAKLCHIDHEIMKMPMGYESLISPLGASLSGGQIQRVLLARALYRRPAILFMDEATSHLDPLNENKINQAIRALDITRIFIAHRPSSIDSADRVIRMR